MGSSDGPDTRACRADRESVRRQAQKVKDRQDQNGMLDAPRKAEKAKNGCYTHAERQTRPVRDVRHTKKGRHGQDGILYTPRKSDKARKGC